MAGAMMLFVDLFMRGGIYYYLPEYKPVSKVDVRNSYIPAGIEIHPDDLVEIELDTNKSLSLEHVHETPDVEVSIVNSQNFTDKVKIKKGVSPFVMPDPVQNNVPVDVWRKHAISFKPAAGIKGKVIIIIDDLGLSEKRTYQLSRLPAPMTFAYLPYADNLKEQTSYARDQGHELMIHVPMEPMSATQDPGPMALRVSMDSTEIDRRLKKVFNSFDGYIGINNHMGSKLTQDSRVMKQVMAELKKRGLVFIDSKTSAKSVAAKTAKDIGLYYAQRDVFLDHIATDELVAGALKQVEDRALKYGYAIAIGHPKSVTINALKEWLPTLADKGLELAPVSAVLRHSPASEPFDGKVASKSDLTLSE